MKQPQPLQVGDHVRTIMPLADLPIGVQGVVRAVFPLGDFYDVLFSEGIGLRIVHRNKLEALRPAQDCATMSGA
jgi:hypothetical protein